MLRVGEPRADKATSNRESRMLDFDAMGQKSEFRLKLGKGGVSRPGGW